MGRASTSSDNSSTFSEATTVCSYTKGAAAATATTTTTRAPRRSLRQKARDVVADLGSPPTKRQDLKDGKPVKSYDDTAVSMIGAGVGGPGRI